MPYFASAFSTAITMFGVLLVAGLAAGAVWLNKRQDKTKVVEINSKAGAASPEVLIQSIADAIVVINNNGVITLINPAAAAMTGWSKDEARGQDVRSVVNFNPVPGNDETSSEDPFSVVLVKKQRLTQTSELTNRDESKKLIVSAIISPVVLGGSEQILGAIAVLRDVSGAHKEELRRAEFISTASHEMRTPVAAIEGYLALALNDRVSTIDERARSYLEKAHSSTQHLGKLFQDLLTSAKAEDGRLSNHPVIVELGDFLSKLVDDLRFSAEKKGLRTELILGGGGGNDHSGGAKAVHPLYYVKVDPERLREVITNLFDNGVKYTESGSLSVRLAGDTDVAQISLKDTGLGIPTEDTKHLFEKFYRVDNSATRTVGGTGLGLFICRSIVELYNGRIWVESQVGKGSTFYINLPRISSQDAERELAAQGTDQKLPAVSL